MTVFYSQAAERLGESIAAQALPDADVLSIAFQHPDPAIAETTVAELVNRYIEAHLEAYGAPAIATFLDRRVSEYEKRLDESEQRLLEFETEHGAFALESPQTTLMQWRDETLQAALRGRKPDRGDPRAPPRRRRLAEARNTQMKLQLEADQLEGSLRRTRTSGSRVVQSFIAGRRAEIEREVGVFASEEERPGGEARSDRDRAEGVSDAVG